MRGLRKKIKSSLFQMNDSIRVRMTHAVRFNSQQEYKEAFCLRGSLLMWKRHNIPLVYIPLFTLFAQV